MPKASLSSAVASLVLAWVGVLLPMLGGERLLAQDVDRSLHLFVIDHSYSMMNRSGRGTRWEFVFGKLGEWLETLPADGSADVSILLFNIEVPGKRPRSNSGDPYLIELPKWSAEDRAKAMAYVEDIGEPRDGEGTALWNALGWAGRKIDAEGSRYSDSWIYLFTDGEDTNSRKRAGDRDFTFPEGDDGREPVLAMWRKLLGKHPNTYMIEQPLGDMEPPLAPEVQEPKNKHIYTSRPELRDQLRVNVAPIKPEYPCVSDPQKVELNVRLAGTGKKRVPKDAVFRVSFRSDDPAIQLQVEPERIPFHEGRQSFTVSVKGGQVRDGVKGRLLFGFDPIEKTDILGPTEAKLQFAAVAKVSIASATPGADLRWPVGRPLDLSVKHTGDSVEWSFGDGATATGGSASHAWNAAGTYEVKVVAKAAGMDPAERKFRVEAVPAGLEVQQRPDQGVIAGKPVLFVANPILAKASRYEWSIDGASRAARNPDGNELELRFDTAGSHEVMVRAYTDICVIERKVVVQVGAGLSLRITKFPSTADAGLTAEFGAEFKGASKKGRLLWEIVDPKTGAAVDATASGASAVAAEASAWAPVVPQSAPASVTVRVRAELEDDEKAVYGDVVDEVVVSIRPPGLHVRKERPADAETLVVGEATPFQAAWSGTGTKAVEDIQWDVTRDGKPVLGAQVVKASKSDGLATSQYSVSLPSSGESLGKQITVTAVPVLGGVPDASHAATWVLSARLPKIDYRVTTNAVSLGGMDYGSALQVGLEPLLHAESVEWDWGDGKVQPAKPNEVLEHTYQLADAGSKRVLARIKRIDGSIEVAQLLFELRAPAFEILNPGAVRINRNAKLKVGPDSLARFVKEVRWDFGAGYGMPETDLETTHLWSDRAGTQPVRAKITLTDGTERLLPELSVNVVASRTIEHDIDVVGGETHGAVELKANIREDSDYLSVETDVFRDGQLVTTLKGVVVSFTIPEGEFGTYTYSFRARRAPSPENGETEVVLGEVSRTYRLRRYVLAFSVLAGGGLLLWLLVWGGVLYQYPRNWRLKVTKDSPFRPGVNLSEIDVRTFPLNRPGKKGSDKPYWGRFQMHKELRIPASAVVRQFPDEDRESVLKWLESDSNLLRIDPRRSRLMDSPGEGWEGPEAHESRRDIHIFSRPATRTRPGDASLFAWIEAKPAGIGSWLVATLILFAGIAAWIWFAMTRCHLFV